jgi:RNA recognition motif-containing protein
MKKKLYVGNLPYTTTEDELKELFVEYEPVHSSKIVRDHETERSRGFGFVLLDRDLATVALEKMNGISFGGRTLRVGEARVRYSPVGERSFGSAPEMLAQSVHSQGRTYA